MKKKLLLTFGLGLVALIANAAIPAFTDFNTNQFSVTGNKVSILATPAITNLSPSQLAAVTNIANNTAGVTTNEVNGIIATNVYLLATGVLATNAQPGSTGGTNLANGSSVSVGNITATTNLTVTGNLIYTPSAAQTLAPGSVINPTNVTRIVIAASNDVPVTLSTTNIWPGVTGQQIEISLSATNTTAASVTFKDVGTLATSGVKLPAAMETIVPGGSMHFSWKPTLNYWTMDYFSPNGGKTMRYANLQVDTNLIVYGNVQVGGTNFANEIVATNGITLGGVRNTTWPSGGGGTPAQTIDTSGANVNYTLSTNVDLVKTNILNAVLMIGNGTTNYVYGLAYVSIRTSGTNFLFSY